MKNDQFWNEKKNIFFLSGKIDGEIVILYSLFSYVLDFFLRGVISREKYIEKEEKKMFSCT